MMTTSARLFRAILTGVIVSVIWTVTSYAANPTRADLLKTLQHISALAKEQQAALDQEKAAHASVAAALGKATRDNQSLQVQINALTTKLNQTQDKLDKCAKDLWWWRLHSLWMKILGVIALLVVGFFVFMWLTGRLAGLASKVASKI